jgi:hypothetical protein
VSKELILQDDGLYYIERNCNGDPDTTNGFLQHRCPVTATTPGGYECVGSYERNLSGTWRASIDVPYVEDSDIETQEFGPFGTRIEAIAALWIARHSAYCRY